MNDITFVPTNEQWNRMIQMHDKKNDEICVGITYPGCVFEKIPCTHFLGGAGLSSTLLDYSNFAQMLLNYGNFNNNVIISPESVKTITKPHVSPKIQPGIQQWGLEGRIITGENKFLLAHMVGAMRMVRIFGWITKTKLQRYI